MFWEIFPIFIVLLELMQMYVHVNVNFASLDFALDKEEFYISFF